MSRQLCRIDGLTHSPNIMATYDQREYTNTRVKRAGERISKGTATAEDWAVLKNWRGVHAYVLNTFQSKIRHLIRGSEHVSAQRLKRKNTIIDKLKTNRSSDLSTMHDIAGCRIICKTIDEVYAVRKRLQKSRSKHKHISGGKYDYLTNPKEDGYRGIHDVFAYQVEGTSGEQYNNLRVEIQYRTHHQHAWATALEISDLIEGTRVKFDSGKNPDKERFFLLASEYIARKFEGMKGFLAYLSLENIVSEMVSLEAKNGYVSRLKKAHTSKTQVPNSKNIVLHFSNDGLALHGATSMKKALDLMSLLEASNPEDEIVYVRAEKPKEVKSVFRNYFSNAAAFLRMMPEEIKRLSSS